jgi:hypothetical protein
MSDPSENSRWYLALWDGFRGAWELAWSLVAWLFALLLVATVFVGGGPSRAREMWERF